MAASMESLSLFAIYCKFFSSHWKIFDSFPELDRSSILLKHFIASMKSLSLFAICCTFFLTLIVKFSPVFWTIIGLGCDMVASMESLSLFAIYCTFFLTLIVRFAPVFWSMVGLGCDGWADSCHYQSSQIISCQNQLHPSSPYHSYTLAPFPPLPTIAIP